MAGRILAVVLAALFPLTGCVTNPGLGPSASSTYETGMTHYRESRYESAIEYFDQTLEIDTEHTRSYLYGGRSLFYLGRWLEASSYLREAYLRMPGDEQAEVAGELSTAMMAYGHQLFTEGRFNDAIDVYSQSLALTPDEIQGHLGLAKAYLGKSDCSQAFITVEQALETSPDSGELQDMLKQITEGH